MRPSEAEMAKQNKNIQAQRKKGVLIKEKGVFGKSKSASMKNRIVSASWDFFQICIIISRS